MIERMRSAREGISKQIGQKNYTGGCPLASMTSDVDSPVVPPLSTMDLHIVIPPMPTSIEGEGAPSVAQAPSLLNGGSSTLKEVLIEVENITTPLEGPL